MRELINKTVNMPDYALCYIINGDSSGIEAEDIENCDNYMKQYYDLANKHNSHVIISPVEDDEGSFNPFPAFGLACNTIECNIIILVDDNITV